MRIWLNLLDTTIPFCLLLVLLELGQKGKEGNIHASIALNVDESIGVLEFDTPIELKHAELENFS